MTVIPRSEHPRPDFERDNWMCLNGEWDFSFDFSNSGLERNYQLEENFDRKILVPFCPESTLSGIGFTDFIPAVWYKRTFSLPAEAMNGRILLHFGAVDYRCKVWVNDVECGSHQGGYTPFTFDITDAARAGENKVVLWAEDDVRSQMQPRGKQSSKLYSHGCDYTRTTGIWQTVWMEGVAANHITAIKAIPDIDNSVLGVTVSTSNAGVTDIVEVQLLDANKQVVAEAKGVQGKEIRLAVEKPQLWSPENPYLYDMKITLLGKIKDEVKSYTAFRKISMEKDAQGIYRMCLNNKPLFQYGPLDQGWWPDGLYTAPTDEALLFDIQKTKEWGFNMIRKHVKVEPARWYYHCDREGMLVWQDMPSGDMGNAWEPHVYNGGTDKQRSQASIDNYYQEWKEIMDLCISNPSVVVWVPFNEAWGQFDTEEVTEWTENYDPSRLVNSASGGNYRPCGDILDLHNYPAPEMYLNDPQHINVLGEYGGIGLPIEDHLWWNKRNWGYIQFKNSDEVTAEYVKYANILKDLVRRGFSAAVYTQTTDVEGEVNGLMTYDRKVIKINEAAVRKVNQEVIKAMTE